MSPREDPEERQTRQLLMDNEFVTTERGDNSVKIHGNKSKRPRVWIGVSLKIIHF